MIVPGVYRLADLHAGMELHSIMSNGAAFTVRTDQGGEILSIG